MTIVIPIQFTLWKCMRAVIGNERKKGVVKQSSPTQIGSYLSQAYNSYPMAPMQKGTPPSHLPCHVTPYKSIWTDLWP